MSWQKRLRVIVAALTQQWHDKTCAECGTSYLAVGKPTELIAICDACEIKNMERFADDMNRKYQDEMKGVW